MPKITSVEEATEVARNYLSPYYRFFRPVRVVQEGARWLVEGDVGAWVTQVVRLKMDGETGTILEFEAEAATQA
jgi:hypothetical protein